MLKPLAEYIKNILRGRKAWGLKIKLSGKWAELPKGTVELTNEQAFPRRQGVKRVRPMADAEGVRVSAMGALGA